MTLEKTLNHEPLLNYLRDRLPQCDVLPLSPYLTLVPAISLIHLDRKGEHQLTVGGEEISLKYSVYVKDDSQIGWYIAEPTFGLMNGMKVADLSFARVGSRESYEFAMHHAVSQDNLELAAEFKAGRDKAKPYEARELFLPPPEVKKIFPKKLMAGLLAGALALGFGGAQVQNHYATKEREQQNLRKQMRHGEIRSHFHAGLNGHFPKEARPFVTGSYIPPTQSLPGRYQYEIIMNMPGTLDHFTISLVEGTGEWWDKPSYAQKWIEQHNLQRIVEEIRQYVRESR